MPRLTDFLGQLVSVRRESSPPAEPVERRCPTCRELLDQQPEFVNLRVCPSCHAVLGMTATERIALLVDPGSFRETDRGLRTRDPLRFADKLPYRERLLEAQRRTGLREAVVTGVGQIDGQRCVLAVLDFEFLGGSMGSVVGEKVARAFELATKSKLPMVAVITTGGARMQEGMLSLVQMAKTAAAAARLQRAGLPYLAVLADPTTGGIYASFASLADVLIAEPGARISFAGSRVIEQTVGERLPDGVGRAEFLLDHGQVDMIVERSRLRGTVSSLLGLLHAPYRTRIEGAGVTPGIAQVSIETPWQTVQIARHPDRPTSLDYVRRMTSSFIELHGDRLYGDDPAVVGGIAELVGRPVVIIAQERGSAKDPSHNDGRARPEGYRKARRLMLLAARLKLPLVTLIDTPGAYPGLASEERGLAHALAECLATMSQLPVPIVSAVVGEGGSGGALALGLADRIVMQEHAIYSVIAPEGAAAILYRDSTRAEEVATALRCTARDCKALGVVDTLVPEPAGGAHHDLNVAAALLKSAIVRELVAIQNEPAGRLVADRYRKYRQMGTFDERIRLIWRNPSLPALPASGPEKASA